MTAKHAKIGALALALGAAFPAAAQSNAEIMEELKALRARVNDLEKQLKEAQAKPPPARAGGGGARLIFPHNEERRPR